MYPGASTWPGATTWPGVLLVPDLRDITIHVGMAARRGITPGITLGSPL